MEEDVRKPADRWSLGCNLEGFGLEELNAYAEALRAELARVEGMAAGKKAYLSDAAKLFKS